MRMVSVAVATPRACRVDRVLGGVRPDFSSSPQTFSCANRCVFEIIWMLGKYSVQEFKTQCGELEIFKYLFTVNTVKREKTTLGPTGRTDSGLMAQGVE